MAVARKGTAPLKQIAKDFGISEGCLHNWMKRADVADDNRPGTTVADAAELREARKRIRLLEQENEVLRRAATYLSQANLPGKIVFPLVREMAAAGAPVKVPVAVACRVLGLSRQGYYQWLPDPVSQRDWDDAHAIDALLDIHEDDPTLGYRFLAGELGDAGITASENRVWRLCSTAGVFASHHRRRGKAGKPGPPVHDDLLGVVDEHGRVTHEFVAGAPNEVWLTDITEHPTGEGKLYLCAVKDVYSNRIVGYSIDSRMKSSLAAAVIRNAIGLRSPAGTICHSDRGSQFRSKKVVRLLKNNGLRGSMGRVAAAGDNAAMESFFALLQKNVLNTRRWQTREDLRLAIVVWIETRYNRRRRQRRLGRLTPVEFEMIYQAADAA